MHYSHRVPTFDRSRSSKLGWKKKKAVKRREIKMIVGIKKYYILATPKNSIATSSTAQLTFTGNYIKN